MELKKLREKLRLSQTEVAKHLGINSQTYNRYETGVNEPNIEMLIKLADFFNVSIDDLVGRESNTINLNYFDDNKKELLSYLVQEDNKTIQRIFDFYNGMKEDLFNRAIGYQKPKPLFEPTRPLFEPYEDDITKKMEQLKFLSNLQNDPYFKKQFEKNKDNK